MKRRNLILSFVAVALLLIGLGYAALTETLTVTGTVSTTEANISLVFSAAESSDKNATLGATGTNTINVKSSAFKTAGDTVTFTLTVSDASDTGLDVKITELGTVTNDNTEYFEITYSGLTVDQVIGANATGQVVITVKLLQTPATDGGVSAEFSFAVKGVAVQE